MCSIEKVVCLDVFLPSSKWYLKTDFYFRFTLFYSHWPSSKYSNRELGVVRLVNTTHNLILLSLVVMKTAVILIILVFMWTVANTHFLQSQLLLCCSKAYKCFHFTKT